EIQIQKYHAWSPLAFLPISDSMIHTLISLIYFLSYSAQDSEQYFFPFHLQNNQSDNKHLQYSQVSSDDESGLVAVIFGAWLMQENDLHEKQIILLTGNDSEREAQIEQQLRELTLLPLNIKHMSVKAFLQTGAPRGAALIIAPYTMPLPLFSPPLIYTDLTLTTHQQEQIRKMLESA
ncbi:hypothetical protein ACUOCP_14120, partial [Escherichia sp. R-CC3]